MSNPLTSIEDALAQAVAHQQAGRIAQAEHLYRAILQAAPGQPEASHNLGRIALDAGRGAEALTHLKTALTNDPTVPHVWLSYIDALIRLQRPSEARRVLQDGKRRGLASELVTRLERRLAAIDAAAASPTPSAPKDHLPNAVRRGATAVDDGPTDDEVRRLNDSSDRMQFDAARHLAAAMAGRYPQHPLGWKVLGRVLRYQNRAQEALQPLTTAARLAPADSEVQVDLAMALETCGRLQEAERHLRIADRLRPADADIQNNLGVLLGRAGRSVEAEPFLREAIRLRPEFAEAYNNLGLLLQRTERLTGAEAAFREALRIKPASAGVLSNLGGLFQATGRMREAESCFRRAIAIEPENVELHSNLLFCQNYTAHRRPQDCLDDARRFGAIAQAQVTSRFRSWPQANAAQRLRVGFVSGDLRGHPVGYFAENLLAHLHASRLELIAYPTIAHGDTLTARLRRRFHRWQPVYGLSDRQAAARIHADGIQVLVDLSGHSGHNRLPVFAWKPAPVQVTWLGYFATTGLAQIDYLLADQHCVPPDHRSHFVEEVWYLPHTRLCFSPPDLDIGVAPLPALERGFVTLGNFQNLAKVGDDVLRLWGRILAAHAETRLRLQNEQLADAAVRQQLGERLQQAGIAADRVSMHGPQPREAYLAAHAEVDLILDTFPYPGGTTTCEALWMGVPTLTLAGDRLIGLQGASLLAAAGLREWIAQTPAEYVDKALAFARDLPALAALRAGLRAQVLASPLFDAARFARHFEDALWGMWQRRHSGVQ